MEKLRILIIAGIILVFGLVFVVSCDLGTTPVTSTSISSSSTSSTTTVAGGSTTTTTTVAGGSTTTTTTVAGGTTTTTTTVAGGTTTTTTTVAGGSTTSTTTATTTTTLAVAAPVATVTAGTYNADQSVELSTTTAGAEIRYTLNGSTPDQTTGLIYSGTPIQIAGTLTLKAKGFLGGFGPSTTSSWAYTLQGLSPTVDISAGTYIDEQAVALSAGAGLDIRYTTDGTTPSATVGTLYSGTAVAINQTQTLRAVSYKTGWTTSGLRTAAYTIKLPTTKTFRAQRVTDSTWYDVASTKLASNTHVVVYAQNGSGVTAPTAQTLANDFETSIYGMIRTNFGNESDFDANGKIILLLLDIVDGYSGSGGYVAGYFDGTHQFATGTYSNSNMADMLFLDTNPSVVGSASFNQTMAHEYQHLVNFNNTVGVNGLAQDTWINEGLSLGAEYIYSGAQVASRTDYYNTDPGNTIRQGNTFYVWNGFWESPAGGSDAVANYSTAYLFFQWLQLHASNGTAIYKEILSSTNRNYMAVTAAASSRIDSSLSDWPTLLGTWMQANFLNKATGLQGYKGEISTPGWYVNNTGGSTWPLSSGEGFVVATSGGTYNYPGGSGSNIKYNGITFASGAIDLTGSVYTGDAVLVYNSNTTIAGADQTAKLPSVQSSLRALRNIQGGGTPPSTYKIDIQLAPGGGFTADSHKPTGRGSLNLLSSKLFFGIGKSW